MSGPVGCGQWDPSVCVGPFTPAAGRAGESPVKHVYDYSHSEKQSNGPRDPLRVCELGKVSVSWEVCLLAGVIAVLDAQYDVEARTGAGGLLQQLCTL